MSLNKKNQLQVQVNDIVQDLSEKYFSSKEIEITVNNLQEIYRCGFRHNYSEFFPIIYTISNSHSEEDGLSCLETNLSEISTFVKEKKIDNLDSYEDGCKQIIKLCDHVNLEIARLRINIINEDKIETATKKVDVLNKKIKYLSVKLEKSSEELNKASDKAKSLQNELITIMSIFAAVVLLFVTDTQYITSAITSMKDVGIFKIVFVIIICGIVLLNGVYLLLNFIYKILEYNSSNKSKKRKNPSEHIILRINIFFIILLIIDTISWSLYKYHIFPFP